MARKRCRRYDEPGHAHELTFSCYRRLPLLSRDRTRGWLVEAIDEARSREKFDLWAYVIMPEHVHLLLSEPPTHPLSTVLGSLKRSVSKQLPETLFWLPRYHDFNVFSPARRIEKLRYLHRNPVTRGLVSTPAEYPWSSFQTYATRIQTTVKINIDLGTP